MRKIIVLHAKKELFRLSYTWLIFPLFVMIFLIIYSLGFFTLESTVPAPIDRFLSEGLLDLNKIHMWLVLFFPLIAFVWLIAKTYKFTRLERTRLRKLYLFIVNQVLNIIRKLSGCFFGLWILQFYPEFGLVGSYERLIESVYFLCVATMLSVFARYMFDKFLVNET